LDLSDNDDDEKEVEEEPQVAVESEKKKGKRKAVEGTEPERVSSSKFSLSRCAESFEFTIRLSTLVYRA
jgi:hypothetical protein